MKFKILFAVLLFVFVFCSALPAMAMTDAEKQALIVQLQAQIVQLQIQIAEIIAQQNGGVWCHTFNNNLGWANTGSSEVYNLHLALQKEGISYSPDDTNVYNVGTSNALIQLQAKYGILQTGYFGNLTRAKLNALYGCVAKECTPSWDCTDWSMCRAGQQTRTCADKNNCGVSTKRPELSQTCTQKPAVKIQADGSDGPLNVFLTLGNGATVTTTGINLTKSIILQWDSIDVSSCTASDSLSPAAFSGFKPSSGSLAVDLSGTIEGTVNSTSKVTDTFKMTCVSTETGKSVADSVIVNLFYNVNANCNPNWDCADWSSCSNKKHTRTCTDWNGCGSLVNKPLETEACTASSN